MNKKRLILVVLVCVLVSLTCILTIVAFSGRDYKESSMSPIITNYISTVGIDEEQIQSIQVDRNGKWNAQRWDIQVIFDNEPNLVYVFQERTTSFGTSFVLVDILGEGTPQKADLFAREYAKE